MRQRSTQSFICPVAFACAGDTVTPVGQGFGFASHVLKPLLRLLEGTIYWLWRTPDVVPFVVSKHTLEIPGLTQAVRVAHLTDLHFGVAQRLPSVRAWVDATLELQADLIVVSGDFLENDRSLRGLDALCAALARLKAPLGVWAVLGNHDIVALRFTRRATLTNALKAAGVQVLENNGVVLRPDLFLAGVDDLWEGSPDIEAALTHAPATGAVLLLSHHPDVLDDVPSRVGLVLCGHTHGGQVNLPWLGRLHTGSKFGERFAEGFVQGNLGTVAFVSRGLGTTALPWRWRCKAELVLLELLPVAGQGEQVKI